MEAGNPLLDDYVLELTGADRPRVCFLPTASGDADHYIVRFYRHFAGACEASHVSLFRRDRCGQAVEGDIAGHGATQHMRRRRRSKTRRRGRDAAHRARRQSAAHILGHPRAEDQAFQQGV